MFFLDADEEDADEKSINEGAEDESENRNEEEQPVFDLALNQNEFINPRRNHSNQ